MSCYSYPCFNTLRASLIQFNQLVLIKLREQTTTSTTWPATSEDSSPGRGNFPHISASITYGFVEAKSYESTVRPSGTNSRARAASPHPKSTMTVPRLLDFKSSMNTSTGFEGHEVTWCLKPVWYYNCNESTSISLCEKTIYLIEDTRIRLHQFMCLFTVWFIQGLVYPPG